MMLLSPVNAPRQWVVVLLVYVVTMNFCDGSERRRSPIVLAIAKARPAVVNIHGHKTIRSEGKASTSTKQREVNGMGTGVIVDERGYIVTNYHVVEGVRQINVTMSGGEAYVARLVAHDPGTDLAVIKIKAKDNLPLIPIGSSHDLMVGEEVIAIGNAYGYEHTHTRGIISALHRTVKVTENQYYRDLIQTDASINPGNSGGPLLNIDGEMIGINVAVRVGAQGIGFAIPTNRAMVIAASLLSAERIGGVWHGIVTAGGTVPEDGVVTTMVQSGSPAARAGIEIGDRITHVNHRQVSRTLDLERAMLGLRPGNNVSVIVTRQKQSRTVELKLRAVDQSQQVTTSNSVIDRAWSEFGIQLQPVPVKTFATGISQFKGGLLVRHVRPNSPADREGVVTGDILVGMDEWVTTSPTDLEFILRSSSVAKREAVKFFVQRGDDVLFGHLPVLRR